MVGLQSGGKDHAQRTATGPLTSQLTVPNDPTLAGLEIYFQGVRLQNASQGEFTNWGWFTIF